MNYFLKPYERSDHLSLEAAQFVQVSENPEDIKESDFFPLFFV